MLFSLGLHPFKDVWLSCIFNMKFSILISLDHSYKSAPYLNNYTYQVFQQETPTKMIAKSLELSFKDTLNEDINGFFNSSQPVNFKTDVNYIEQLKEIIKRGKIIMVGVDLFYWRPDSICWNKHHWEHYSLINGFDDEKKVFYGFDDDYEGYDEFEIPEERFCMAIKNSPLNPHGYIYNKISNNISHFELNLNEVVYYAEQLAAELKTMKVNSFWQLNDEDFASDLSDLLAMFISQIVNRQKANQMLFQALQKETCFNDPRIIEFLIEKSQGLQKGWTSVKNKFIKAHLSNNKQADIIALNEKVNHLLSKEHEMWSKFLSFVNQ